LEVFGAIEITEADSANTKTRLMSFGRVNFEKMRTISDFSDYYIVEKLTPPFLPLGICAGIDETARRLINF
jgi:hypothetical protein